MAIGTVQTLVVCTQPLNPCPLDSQSVVSGYLLDPGVASLAQVIFDEGGIDWALVSEIFGAGIALYASGFGFALMIAVVRKLR